jgi:hypothetical protein
LDPKESLDTMVTMEQMVLLVLKENVVLWALWVLKVQQVLWVNLVLKVLLVE